MKKHLNAVLLIITSCLILLNIACNKAKSAEANKIAAVVKTDSVVVVKPEPGSTIDTVDYNKRMLALANNDTTGRWPVKAPYPLAGAILPYHRIVAFYGNLYSKRMGILGEIPKEPMLKKLNEEVMKWQAADPTVKAIPALHYIATTAQGAPGKDGMHRMRLAHRQIDTIISWARPIKALIFLDIQVGHSTVKVEVPTLEKYLMMPDVHLGIDPEFSLKNGHVPGTKIGTMDATDINDAIDYLQKIVIDNKIPPKVLIVHRFTQGMVTNYKNIKTCPEVQVVMDMDGFGDKVLKKSTYLTYIKREPVQFTGFKLFYKNDIRKDPNGMFTPAEVLNLMPKPIYIQYQ